MIFVDWTLPLNVDASQMGTTGFWYVLLSTAHDLVFAILFFHSLFMRHLPSAFNVCTMRSRPRVLLISASSGPVALILQGGAGDQRPARVPSSSVG